ncbi:hypothetical protein [Candidatus Accumulibacter sp. ACC005]|uniref:hypothetical protein n=1 Tax=Candidatus Accumulibacter sp. ACC005 TaxID=2823331 RepID=UPI0025C39399|nr:hypothetical protein [Candidatus Accumulibacter sp. ACC005]
MQIKRPRRNWIRGIKGFYKGRLGYRRRRTGAVGRRVQDPLIEVKEVGCRSSDQSHALGLEEARQGQCGKTCQGILAVVSTLVSKAAKQARP